MFNQDRTNDALGLLKRMTDDIEANIRSPETVYIEVIFCVQNTKGQFRRGSMASGEVSVMQYRKMSLAILDRLSDMEEEIHNAATLQKKEAVHVH